MRLQQCQRACCIVKALTCVMQVPCSFKHFALCQFTPSVPVQPVARGLPYSTPPIKRATTTFPSGALSSSAPDLLDRPHDHRLSPSCPSSWYTLCIYMYHSKEVQTATPFTNAMCQCSRLLLSGCACLTKSSGALPWTAFPDCRVFCIEIVLEVR